MWANNRVTKSLNLKWPIFQAPMGEYTTPELAASVSNSGGLELSECGAFLPRK